MGKRRNDGRIMIYSHDTFGLGHLRRCRTIAHALVDRFKAEGVTRVRTLVDLKDHLILSFFRAQGMVAGPSLQLDMDLA